MLKGMKQEGEIQTFKGDTGTVRNEEDQESNYRNQSRDGGIC